MNASLFRNRGLRPWCLVLLFAATALAAPSATKPEMDVAVPRRVLVGYFPQWGLYGNAPYTVKSLVETGGARMVDQLNYAQGFVTGGRCSVADPNADLAYTFTAENSVDGEPDAPDTPLRGNFNQLLKLKRMYPHLKILISLEGRGSDFAADARPEARDAFVASCVDLFLKGNFGPQASAPGLFDGIDLDWEFPRGPDAANYLPLLTEFRRQMDELRPGLQLTVALGPSPQMYGGSDMAALGRIVDLAGLMTYDFNGPWSSTTGFIAPLSSAEPGDDSVQRSVAAWKAAGVPAAKLLIGLPFYAYGWRSVASENHGLRQDGSPIRGDHPYRFIQNLIDAHPDRPAQAAAVAAPPAVAPVGGPAPQPAATEATMPSGPVLYRDPVSKAPWLFDGNAFWTYEDATSIETKAAYAAQEQLGGFMVWELSEDTPAATLLHAAHDALARPEQSNR